MQRASKKGFSLLEMSIVLLIIALISAASISSGATQIRISRNSSTQAEINALNGALVQYFNIYKRFPVPADGTLASTSSSYGAEGVCGTGGVTRVEYPASSGSWVCRGAVPFAALGLPADLYSDAWGQEYTYAVLQSLTTVATADPAAFIRIVDGAGNTISNQATYVILSSGATGKGGRTTATNTVTDACSGTDLDRANCTNAGPFMDAHFNDVTGSAAFFDDIINWGTLLQTNTIVCNGAVTYYGRFGFESAVRTNGSACSDTLSVSPLKRPEEDPALVYWFDGSDINGNLTWNDGIADGAAITTWKNKAIAGAGRDANCGAGVSLSRGGMTFKNSVRFNGSGTANCVFDIRLLEGRNYIMYVYYKRDDVTVSQTPLSSAATSGTRKFYLRAKGIAAPDCTGEFASNAAIYNYGTSKVANCTGIKEDMYLSATNTSIGLNYEVEGKGAFSTGSAGNGLLTGLLSTDGLIGMEAGGTNRLTGNIASILIYDNTVTSIFTFPSSTYMLRAISGYSSYGDYTFDGKAGPDIYKVGNYGLNSNIAFQNGIDKIDLKGMNLDASSYTGANGGFLGLGKRSFYFEQNSGWNYIRFDLAGNGSQTDSIGFDAYNQATIPITDYIFN